ncbi:xanthine dehydrogenase family protein molybdopterin-binding subunit [Piscinibacter sp. HJYY11]|uniref:xanthine dehydrogenase family protein molybdopterin-binding subunit n=1 Tax=Piscinibacter sp. HJYY11 TaxID=2801333 RepID=UPI00191E936C|nr:molybdopterin cofactor-binding domain-containing protein [Piscinibacter sp. HJYY11]MBL0727734.1 xanthine dehydrogenase family protein molybdopterin-binding subunit [Piscinibacter sp. HJYY11]
MSATLSRRTLLATAGGITVSFGLGGCSLIPPIPKRPAPTLDDAVGWIHRSADGRFVLWCPRVEMGQNVLGGLRRIAALELGVGEESIDVRIPGTGDIGRVKGTVGSDSVRELLVPLATACARLRDEMKAQGVEPPPLRAIGALRQAATSPPVAQPQHHALVTGAPVFAADVRLPGMLHASVLRPPWRPELGVELEGWDREAVQAVPGFVAQLTLPGIDGPVLVGRDPQSIFAMRTAAAVRWKKPAHMPDAERMVDIDAVLATGRFTKDSGSVEDGAWTVDLRLDVPMAAHAAIEPRCAVARFDTTADGKLTLDLWCATQDPFFIRDVMARDHGLPVERITVHNQRLGGGFGGRTLALVEREAAYVARPMKAPVKLQWTREDEFTGAFHRPPSSHRVKVRVGADGLITDWWHALSSSHVIFTSAGMPPWMQTFTDFVGDAGTSRGQHAPYAFTRQRRSMQLTRVPLATGPWRGLGAGPNVLAIEAAMDAAARASRQDPVAFRLRHLANAPAGEHLADPARLGAVLQRVAERAKREAPRAAAAGERVGRGVACGVYKGLSVVAAVAEVAVTAERIRVTRLWCSHDCGAMVDARSVRAQVEGNLVWSLSLVLFERLSAPDARAAQTGLADYPLPRITDMPTLDIDLVPSDKPPSGAGEAAIVAGAGALYNALVAASGKQPTRLPVTPADLA